MSVLKLTPACKNKIAAVFCDHESSYTEHLLSRKPCVKLEFLFFATDLSLVFRLLDYFLPSL
jgi:hypothetical protein